MFGELMLFAPDHMPLLVRIIRYSSTGRRLFLANPTHEIAFSRRQANDRLPKMGDNDSLDHNGCSKCGGVGSSVHLQIEEAQSFSQRQAWKRVQTAHRCVDAGE